MTRQLTAVLIMIAGCANTNPTYYCSKNDECTFQGLQGICIERTCALPSTDCPSGYKFHESAGSLAGTCVEPGTPDGGPFDMFAKTMDGPQLSDLSTPDSGSCPIGEHLCSAQCVDDTSIMACGSSCTICKSLNEVPACIAGRCVVPGSLLIARSGLAIVTGPDGRVYALGGVNIAAGNLSSVEVFDAGTNQWVAVAQMQTPRSSFATATGPDGRIYVFGGNGNANASIAEAEAYSPLTNTWLTITPLPTARKGAAAVVGKDGRIYVIGGYSTQKTAYLGTVEVYSPAQNLWTTVTPLPTPRSELGAVVVQDGRIFTVGGYSGSALDLVEVYSPSSNSWTLGPSLLRKRNSFATTRGADGKIYIVGGINYNPTAYLGWVDVLDPTNGTWTSAVDLPTPRAGLAAVTGADRLLYAAGGIANGSYVATVEAYSVASGSW